MPRFGSAVIAQVEDLAACVRLAQRVESAGLDFATVIDHPYNPAMGESWTMMTAYAMATSKIRLRTTVMCTPLRQAAVLARGASTLELLTSGRVDLGLGAGGVWEGITSVGYPQLSPADAVQQLTELITVMRALWQDDNHPKEAMVGHYEGGVRTMREQAPEAGWGEPVTIEGKFHSLSAAYCGPRPTHPIPIYIGGNGPRMMRLTGRLADGVALSHGRKDAAGYRRAHQLIDEAAIAAGRHPRDITRMYQVFGTIGEDDAVDLGGRSGFRGTVDQWIDYLMELIVEHGFDEINFYPVNDEARMLRYAEEIVPAVRERLAKEGYARA
ncbi:LLM class flavin-dependent oxidoreductase [Streptomyces mirabilis]|uniref:LLM class flavin-dependent oxidoreductase n=1 Tax=Streptomyces mirabilis TaxID=68239 RepID=UPI0036D17E70